MNHEVKVWTKKKCQQCKLLKKKLVKLNIPFIEINLDTNEEEKNRLTSLGYSALPVVKFDNEIFTGFQPSKIEELAKAS